MSFDERTAVARNDEPLVEVPATLEEWKDKAIELWCLLDDVDTYGDMFKPEHSPYFTAVNGKVALRHKILETDGHRVVNTAKTRTHPSHM